MTLNFDLTVPLQFLKESETELIGIFLRKTKVEAEVNIISFWNKIINVLTLALLLDVI